MARESRRCSYTGRVILAEPDFASAGETVLQMNEMLCNTTVGYVAVFHMRVTQIGENETDLCRLPVVFDMVGIREAGWGWKQPLSLKAHRI